MIFILILLVLITIVGTYSLYRGIVSAMLFKYDKYNPYRRHCKKCNSHQVMYSSNIEGDNSWWWEEVYPIGNNDKCKCHSFSDYRP